VSIQPHDGPKCDQGTGCVSCTNPILVLHVRYTILLLYRIDSCAMYERPISLSSITCSRTKSTISYRLHACILPGTALSCASNSKSNEKIATTTRGQSGNPTTPLRHFQLHKMPLGFGAGIGEDMCDRLSCCQASKGAKLLEPLN
jgi:hypothetical protein